MRKKLLYIGLVLIIAGIAVGLIVPGSIIPSLFPTPTSQPVVVEANSISDLPLQLNESGLPILTFNSTAPIDFYFSNASAFGAISAAGKGASPVNTTARSVALGLEGTGVYEVYEDSASGAFPFISYPNVTAPVYLLNITLLQPGTYYAILYNTGNSVANVTVTSLSVSLSKIQSGETSVGIYIIIAAVLFIGGIGLSIYSLVAKDRSKEQAAADAEAAHEYEKIEKHGRKANKK